MNSNSSSTTSNSEVNGLVVEHPYFCATECDFDPESTRRYATLEEFLSDADAHSDPLNLCFRWDLERKEKGGFYALIFTVRQRRGIFVPVLIENVAEAELGRLEVYLRRHWFLLKEMWRPISAEENLIVVCQRSVKLTHLRSE